MTGPETQPPLAPIHIDSSEFPSQDSSAEMPVFVDYLHHARPLQNKNRKMKAFSSGWDRVCKESQATG